MLKFLLALVCPPYAIKYVFFSPDPKPEYYEAKWKPRGKLTFKKRGKFK